MRSAGPPPSRTRTLSAPPAWAGPIRRPAARSTVAVLGVWLLWPGAFGCSESPTAPDRDPITELPRALSEIELELVSTSNHVAFALAKELLPREADSNLFYSPLSASMLLGMILNGAGGETRAQIRSVLGFDALTEEQINRGYADLVELLLRLDSSVTIDLGSSIWTEPGFPLLPDFLERVRSSFGAEAESVSFDDPGTLDRINRWASEATRGRIETIFDALPSNAVMVLLNAIYFDASWVNRFDPDLTEPAPFTRPDGSTVDAPLMRLDGRDVPIAHPDGATMVELPYGRGAFGMVAVMPARGTTVRDFVSNLTEESWDAWTRELAPGRAYVRLPRFELEWESRLNEPLVRLGMSDAFGAADFSRLTPGGGLWLDVVKQKTFVRVDEEGTEAAAVSGGVGVTSAPPEIRFDRPFLVVIRERLSGTIVFMGVIHDPTA